MLQILKMMWRCTLKPDGSHFEICTIVETMLTKLWLSMNLHKKNLYLKNSPKANFVSQTEGSEWVCLQCTPVRTVEQNGADHNLHQYVPLYQIQIRMSKEELKRMATDVHTFAKTYFDLEIPKQHKYFDRYNGKIVIIGKPKQICFQGTWTVNIRERSDSLEINKSSNVRAIIIDDFLLPDTDKDD